MDDTQKQVDNLNSRVGKLEKNSFGNDPAVNPQTIANLKQYIGTLSPSGVSQAIAGTGIGVSPAGGTGAVTINNTGVTSLTAGSAISLSGSTGAITVGNNGVKSIIAGTGISVSGATGDVTVSSSIVGIQGFLATGDGTTDYSTSTATFVAVDATNLLITLSGFSANTVVQFTVGLSNQAIGTAGGDKKIRLQDITNGVTMATIVDTSVNSGSALPYFTSGVYKCGGFPATIELEYAAGNVLNTNKIINSGAGSFTTLYSGFTTSSGAGQSLAPPFFLLQVL